MRPTIPAEILALGRARSAARRARDFREADRLRAEIEAAGYRVVDQGTESVLSPAHPADVVEGDVVRYGWSGSVPSRLEEPSTKRATILLLAASGAPGVEALRRTLAGLRAHAPAGTQVVIVAPPDPVLDAALTPDDLLVAVAGAGPEVVRTAVPLRPAAARNAGSRRAAGEVVMWLEAGATVDGDIVTPLVEALDDPSVAVAGAVGLGGREVRRLEPTGAPGDADAIDRTALAFRRSDLALGPLDERFHGDEQLDRWWSLVLRAGPGAAPTGDAPTGDAPTGDAPARLAPARRALALSLPMTGAGGPGERDHLPEEAGGGGRVDPAEAARRRKRDTYRVIDRFIGRPDLLRARVAPEGVGDPTG